MHGSFAALRMTICGALLTLTICGLRAADNLRSFAPLGRWDTCPYASIRWQLLDLNDALTGVRFDFINARYDLAGEIVERFAG